MKKKEKFNKMLQLLITEICFFKELQQQHIGFRMKHRKHLVNLDHFENEENEVKTDKIQVKSQRKSVAQQ